jgi:hypothetical protein
MLLTCMTSGHLKRGHSSVSVDVQAPEDFPQKKYSAKLKSFRSVPVPEETIPLSVSYAISYEKTGPFSFMLKDIYGASGVRLEAAPPVPPQIVVHPAEEEEEEEAVVEEADLPQAPKKTTTLITASIPLKTPSGKPLVRTPIFTAPLPQPPPDDDPVQDDEPELAQAAPPGKPGQVTPAISTKRLGARLKDRVFQAKSHFAPLPLFPYIRYDEPHECFVVTLPPFSCVYSEDLFFFNVALRMTKAELRSVVIGPAIKQVSGFWNDRGDTGVEIVGREAVEGSAVDEEMPEMVTFVNATTTVYYQRLEVMTVLEAADEVSVETETLASEITNLLSRHLVGDFLAPTLVSVKVSNDRDLIFSNEAVEASGLIITISFNNVVRDQIGLQGPVLTFDLAVKNEHVLKPRTRGENPFEERYPLVLTCKGMGNGKSYINGKGHESVMAIIDEDEDASSSSTLEFNMGKHRLEIGILDKTFKPIIAETAADLYMTFFFEPLTPPPGHHGV